MIVGKVVGSIVSTRKSEKLIGNKFMIVEPVHHMKAEHSQIVAIDIIGAGIGEYVLVAQGSAARIGCGVETARYTLYTVSTLNTATPCSIGSPPGRTTLPVAS